MTRVWDYDEKELKKTQAGRTKIIERMVNFGVYLKDKEKIPLKDLKRFWDKLRLDPDRRRFLKFIIWGK